MTLSCQRHCRGTVQNETKQKVQNRRQSVVAGRQLLYCAVQSQSPSHLQMTTEKVQSSARDGTSSAMGHSRQTMAGCSMHNDCTCRSHLEGTVTECWTVPLAWLCQQNADDVRCPAKAPSKVRRRCSMKTVVDHTRVIPVVLISSNAYQFCFPHYSKPFLANSFVKHSAYQFTLYTYC